MVGASLADGCQLAHKILLVFDPNADGDYWCVRFSELAGQPPASPLVLRCSVGKQNDSLHSLFRQVAKLLLGTSHPFVHEGLPGVLSKRINGLVQQLPLGHRSKRNRAAASVSK